MDLDGILQRVELAVIEGDWREASEASEEWWDAVLARGAEHTATEVQRERYRGLSDRLDAMGPRRITTTFDEVTPESAEDGDTSDAGWEDFVGQPMEGDDAPDEDLSAVENAIHFIKREGWTEASSSHFHPGIWYTQEASEDPYTGTSRTRAFHLDGPWTEDEQRQIFEGLKRRR